MPVSRSFEALLDKTKATLVGKSHSQNVQCETPPEEQKIFYATTLPKLSSQGTVTSDTSEKRLMRGSSLFLQGSPTARLDTWKCHGPFSHCFLRRKTSTDGDDEEGEMPSRVMSSVYTASLKTDSKSEQRDAAAALNDTSLKSRLAWVNSMKGKTYSLHTGFALARKDALEIASVLRFSVSHLCRSEKQEGNEADTDTLSQLLSMQANVLSCTCSRMAMEYSTPEELLLTLTHSFHALCCLTQACMSLVEGLSFDNQRRAVVAKVDEVIINYVCLLKAAQVASGSSPSNQSVNTLMHHSSTMSAVINALTCSLKTLHNKSTYFLDY